MDKRVIFGIGAAVALIAAGCTNVASFDYTSAQGTMSKFQEAGMATKTVAVMPFLDQRGTKYFDPNQAAEASDHPYGDHGSFYWGFLPLFPFGWVQKEEPENSEDFVSLGRFHMDVQNDLANAAQVSLKASNLFADVRRANNLQQANADYVWRGRVTNTYYRGNMYSYFISYFFSPVLWVIGFPMGTSFNDLWVGFDLIDRKDGRVLWTYEYRGGEYLNHWLYARYGQDANMYARLMKQAMNGALYDLSTRHPELLK